MASPLLRIGRRTQWRAVWWIYDRVNWWHMRRLLRASRPENERG